MATDKIKITGAFEHNLKGIDVEIPRQAITVVTGVSGSGKSSLAFDTILAEAQRRFFYTLSHYTRQFLDLGSRPAVRSVSGLSPAISLAQNETLISRRSTVGTLTDASELFGVLFARFGTQLCPRHLLPTAPQAPSAVAATIKEKFFGKTLAICIPFAAAKKGNFKAPLTKFAEKGYARAFIDGKVVPLTPMPELAREEKHTIKIIVDYIKVKDSSDERLERSIATALREGEGFGEYYSTRGTDGLELDLARGGTFSQNGGCPTCGFSWPRLDSRYFSANSLGRCRVCNGYGEVGIDSTSGDEVDVSESLEDETASQSIVPEACESCRGTGIDIDRAAILFSDLSIHDLMTMPVSGLRSILASPPVLAAVAKNPALRRVVQELEGIVSRIIDVGLSYLSLSRRIATLSGGEAQRIRLAGILAESLRGVLYVLDEPSQGLHPAELDLLWNSLDRLKRLGNTIVIVDHDEFFIKRADLIIDLGPGGGASGGKLMAAFAPSKAGDFARLSQTAAILAGRESDAAAANDASRESSRVISAEAPMLEVTEPRLFNLRLDKVSFVPKALNVVTGVSGAGKSTLVINVLVNNLRRFASRARTPMRKPSAAAWYHCRDIRGFDTLSSIWVIDRRPVAKSSSSMPASYLGFFTEIRELYGNLPDAQVAGLTPRSFSLQVSGGRCEECRGRGEANLSMRFLADARVQCPVCRGKRYRAHVLDLRYNGLNINDVLNLTIAEAAEFFSRHPKIAAGLKGANDLGLGYLKLGQPTSSLSGGEAQRLKIAPFLGRRQLEGVLFVLDEPTTGLHTIDVRRLIARLHELCSAGATVIMIEHSAEVIRAADWIVDLGPGPAEAGGQVVYEGPLKGLLRSKESVTARYLK